MSSRTIAGGSGGIGSGAGNGNGNGKGKGRATDNGKGNGKGNGNGKKPATYPALVTNTGQRVDPWQFTIADLDNLRTIMVRNLPRNYNETAVGSIFRKDEYGDFRTQVVKPRRSNSFSMAYIEFKDVHTAVKAMNDHKNTIVEGVKLEINRESGTPAPPGWGKQTVRQSTQNEEADAILADINRSASAFSDEVVRDSRAAPAKDQQRKPRVYKDSGKNMIEAEGKWGQDGGAASGSPIFKSLDKFVARRNDALALEPTPLALGQGPAPPSGLRPPPGIAPARGMSAVDRPRSPVPDAPAFVPPQLGPNQRYYSVVVSNIAGNIGRSDAWPQLYWLRGGRIVAFGYHHDPPTYTNTAFLIYSTKAAAEQAVTRLQGKTLRGDRVVRASITE